MKIRITSLKALMIVGGLALASVAFAKGDCCKKKDSKMTAEERAEKYEAKAAAFAAAAECLKKEGADTKACEAKLKEEMKNCDGGCEYDNSKKK